MSDRLRPPPRPRGVSRTGTDGDSRLPRGSLTDIVHTAEEPLEILLLLPVGQHGRSGGAAGPAAGTRRAGRGAPTAPLPWEPPPPGTLRQGAWLCKTGGGESSPAISRPPSGAGGCRGVCFASSAPCGGCAAEPRSPRGAGSLSWRGSARAVQNPAAAPGGLVPAQERHSQRVAPSASTKRPAGNKAVTSGLLPPCRLCPQSSLRAPASRLGRCRPEHAPSCASARGNETQGQAVLQQRHASQRPQALAREASPSFSPCSPAGWVPLAVQSSLCIQLLLTQSTFPAGHAHARTWLQ